MRLNSAGSAIGMSIFPVFNSVASGKYGFSLRLTPNDFYYCF